ncbi:MAG: hypothetical protein CM15mP59_3620 [Flavobacteriaceae bacterium]|nr:MAG: hypothetical protein CM15mP59_3620 [Flavobacteriaceae bacterium]
MARRCIQAQPSSSQGLQNDALLSEQKPCHVLLDHNDRDSMIFADGAGATILKIQMKMGAFYHIALQPILSMKPTTSMPGSYCNPKNITPNTSKWRGAKCMSLH